MSLESLRRKIDSLDQKILALLVERAKIAQRIGRAKKAEGREVYSVERENEVLQKILGRDPSPLPPEAVEAIFREIFHSCRSLQKKLKIAYLGPEATFTHQAALNHFGRAAEHLPGRSIADVFDDVEKERADYGVVPIENSTEGVVNHTLDMFITSDLKIVAEREEPITHCLLSTNGDIKKIRHVYSHPQALAQCRKFLDRHLPKVTIHESASTADAAAQAALDSSAAAIASPMAAAIYHLKFVARRIEDLRENFTRFLIIGRRSPPPTGRDKTSLLFSIQDRVGALHDMLVPFRVHGINLTKIESRPARQKAWQYYFFVDCEGHAEDPPVRRALSELEKQCRMLKVLGSYPRAE